MKERLLVWRELVRDRLRDLLIKLGPVFRKLLPALSFFGRKTFYFLGLPILLASFIGFGLFMIYPAYELKPWIIRQIVKDLKAEKVSIGDLRWDHSFLFLNLGVVADDVKIDRGAWVDHAEVESMRVSIRPLELLKSGAPFDIELERFKAILSSDNPNEYNDEIVDQVKIPETESKMVSLLKKVLSGLNGYKLTAKNSEIELPLFPKKEMLTLKNISLEASTGISQKQQISMKAFIDLGAQDGSWAVAGPIHLEAESTLIKKDGVPRTIDFNKFDLDLSKASFSALGVFERIGESRLKLSAMPRIEILPHGEGLGIESFEIPEGDLFYDDLKVGLKLVYLPGKEWDLEWVIGRSEVENLRLPLVGLRRSPGKGIITSHGRVVLRDTYERSEAKWHLILNNFRMHAESIAAIFGDTRAIEGELKMSAISEGNLRAGLLESARTEMQLDGDNVQIEFPNGHFIKPMGNKLSFLMRLKKFGRKMDIEDVTFKLHTLEANLRGSIDRPFMYLFDKFPGEYDLDFRTNNIDLSDWSAFFPSFRKVPLQGFFEVVSSIKGPLLPNSKSIFDDMQWRIDKLHLSNIQGSIDSDLGSRLSLASYQDEVAGPFSLTFYFAGRGQSSKIERARLLAQADFSKATLWIEKILRKPRDVPLQLQLSLEQSQNRVDIEKGFFSFADLGLNFSGKMIQGSKGSRLNVALANEVDLSKWREFLLNKDLSESLSGKWWLNGSFGLDSGLNMEKDIDWKSLIFEGQVQMSDLSWRSDYLKRQVSGLNGRLDLLRDSLLVKEFNFREDNKIFSLDGSLRPKFEDGKLHKTVYLYEWLGANSWDAEGSLTVPALELTSFLRDGESSGEFGFPKSWYEGSFFKHSTVDLNLAFDDLYWADINLGQKFLAKLKLDEGRLRFAPLSIRRKGALVKGEYNIDFNPIWARSGTPLQSSNLVFEKLPASALGIPIDLGEAPISGTISGTTEGNFLSDWKNNLKTKVKFTGLKSDGIWVKKLQPLVDEFFAHHKARDYLLTDAQKSKCDPIAEKVYFEGAYSSGLLDVERMRFELQSGGRLDLIGKVEEKSDEQMASSGRGAFIFPSRCLSKRAQTCLSKSQKHPYLPLEFAGSSLASTAYDYDLTIVSSAFATCMENQVTVDVNKNLQKRKQKSAKPGP